MRRTILGWGIILLIISMAVISYAGTEKVAISKENAVDLKGNWTGDRSVGPCDRRNTSLEISSESLPVEGKFIFNEVKRPGGAIATVPVPFKAKINEQGNLLIVGGNTEIELSLYKDGGKMKLEGNFFWYGEKGNMSLKKK